MEAENHGQKTKFGSSPENQGLIFGRRSIPCLRLCPGSAKQVRRKPWCKVHAEFLWCLLVAGCNGESTENSNPAVFKTYMSVGLHFRAPVYVVILSWFLSGSVFKCESRPGRHQQILTTKKLTTQKTLPFAQLVAPFGVQINGIRLDLFSTT